MHTPITDHVPAGSDAFDRLFLQTVLRINDVHGVPTPQQYTDALHTLAEYGTKVDQARERELADDSDWLLGPLQENLAVERAFLFVRFDSVMRKTPLQDVALHKWLRSRRAA